MRGFSCAKKQAFLRYTRLIARGLVPRHIARGLLRSPSPIGSAMQKCKHFCIALATLLVLNAADREPVILGVVTSHASFFIVIL